MATPVPEGTLYCPRSCHKNRTYASLEDLKKHVREAHPDYDPEWFDTYPEETK